MFCKRPHERRAYGHNDANVPHVIRPDHAPIERAETENRIENRLDTMIRHLAAIKAAIAAADTADTADTI
jgi:hypothetical protein